MKDGQIARPVISVDRYHSGLTMMRLRYLTVFMFFVITLMILTGCAGFGYVTALIPADADGWKYARDSEAREYGSKYECGRDSLFVSEVLVDSQLLAAGFLVPVIPLPIPVGGPERVFLLLYVSGTPVDLSEQSITIVLPDKTMVRPEKFEKRQHFSNKPEYYEYTFPVRGKDVESFDLLFQEHFHECRLTPLQFRKQTVFRAGWSVPGP